MEFRQAADPGVRFISSGNGQKAQKVLVPLQHVLLVCEHKTT